MWSRNLGGYKVAEHRKTPILITVGVIVVRQQVSDANALVEGGGERRVARLLFVVNAFFSCKSCCVAC